MSDNEHCDVCDECYQRMLDSVIWALEDVDDLYDVDQIAYELCLRYPGLNTVAHIPYDDFRDVCDTYCLV